MVKVVRALSILLAILVSVLFTTPVLAVQKNVVPEITGYSSLLLDKTVTWSDSTTEHVHLNDDLTVAIDGVNVQLVGMDISERTPQGIGYDISSAEALAWYGQQFDYLESIGVRTVQIQMHGVTAGTEAATYAGWFDLAEQHHMLVYALITARYYSATYDYDLEDPDDHTSNFPMGAPGTTYKVDDFVNACCAFLDTYDNIIAVSADNEIDLKYTGDSYTTAQAINYMTYITGLIATAVPDVPLTTKICATYAAGTETSFGNTCRVGFLPLVDFVSADAYYATSAAASSGLAALKAWFVSENYTKSLWLGEYNGYDSTNSSDSPVHTTADTTKFDTTFISSAFGQGYPVVYLWSSYHPSGDFSETANFFASSPTYQLIPTAQMASIANYLRFAPALMGYYGGFSDMLATLDDIDFDKLTHVILTSVSVVSDSDPTLREYYNNDLTILTDMVTTAKSKNPSIKCLVNLYGTTNLGTILNDAGLRATLVSNMVTMMSTYSIDGYILDWEGASPQATYDTWISDLRTALPSALLGACDGATSMYYSAAASADLDYIMLMGYDIGSYPNRSSYAKIVTEITNHTSAGYSATKMVLGIPFFGSDNNSNVGTWGEIVDELNPADDVSSMPAATIGGHTVDGGTLWWSGVDVNEQKIDYCQAAGMAGFFIFTVCEDDFVNGNNMLANIYDYIQLHLTSPGTPSLVSITISPAGNVSIGAGNTRQFTATGVYSDSSSATITSSVTWNSTNTVAATVSASGLVTGVAAGGTTLITASLSGITSTGTVVTVVTAAAVSIDSPDVKTITATYVYRHLLQTDDQLYITDCTWDYISLSYPNVTLADSVMYQVCDSGGVALSSSAPAAGYGSATGYGRFVVAQYFAAADAPTWLGDYTTKLIGNPSLTWSDSTPPSVSAGITYWSSSITQSASRAELAARIIALARALGGSWNVVDMVQGTTEGDKLGNTGIAYFASAIPNCQLMAPGAFLAELTNPEFFPEKKTNANAIALLVQKVGTPLDFSDLATATHISEAWIGSIVALVITGILAFMLYKRTKNTRGIVLFIDFCFILASIKGMLPLAVVIGLGAIMFILTGYALFYQKSSA